MLALFSLGGPSLHPHKPYRQEKSTFRGILRLLASSKYPLLSRRQQAQGNYSDQWLRSWVSRKNYYISIPRFFLSWYREMKKYGKLYILQI